MYVICIYLQKPVILWLLSLSFSIIFVLLVNFHFFVNKGSNFSSYTMIIITIISVVSDPHRWHPSCLGYISRVTPLWFPVQRLISREASFLNTFWFSTFFLLYGAILHFLGAAKVHRNLNQRIYQVWKSDYLRSPFFVSSTWSRAKSDFRKYFSTFYFFSVLVFPLLEVIESVHFSHKMVFQIAPTTIWIS